MSYKSGIIAAITELKDRTGSSSIAIKKHMQVRGWTHNITLLSIYCYDYCYTDNIIIISVITTHRLLCPLIRSG